MLEQILTQAMSYIQLITAALLFIGVVLELIHIGQTRRINKKLSYAAHWLQRYLNAVFNEETEEPAGEEAQPEPEAVPEPAPEPVPELEAMPEPAAAQLEVSTLLKSRQEENMRVSLAQKKLQKDEELLDTVLQEVFGNSSA